MLRLCFLALLCFMGLLPVASAEAATVSEPASVPVYITIRPATLVRPEQISTTVAANPEYQHHAALYDKVIKLYTAFLTQLYPHQYVHAALTINQDGSFAGAGGSD